MRGVLLAVALMLAGCGSEAIGSAPDSDTGGSGGTDGGTATHGGSTAAGGPAEAEGGQSGEGGETASEAGRSQGGRGGKPAGGSGGKGGGSAAGSGGDVGSSAGAGSSGGKPAGGGGTGGGAPAECACYTEHGKNKSFCVAFENPKGFACVECGANDLDCDGDTVEPAVGSGCEVHSQDYCPL